MCILGDPTYSGVENFQHVNVLDILHIHTLETSCACLGRKSETLLVSWISEDCTVSSPGLTYSYHSLPLVYHGLS